VQTEIVSEIAAPPRSRQTPSCTRRIDVDQSANGSEAEIVEELSDDRTKEEEAAATASALDRLWPSHGRDLGGRVEVK
jgi:hypothetical protein